MVICWWFSLPENKHQHVWNLFETEWRQALLILMVANLQKFKMEKVPVVSHSEKLPQIGIGENTKTIVLHICFILSSFEKLNLNNLPEVVFLSVMHATGSDVHMPSMSNVCARMPPRNLLIARDTRNCTLWGMQLQYSGACEGSHHVPNWMNLWN